MSQNYHGSSRISPTGFPIIEEHWSRVYIQRVDLEDLRYDGGNRFAGNMDIDFSLPADLPAGTYRPTIFFEFNGFPTADVWPLGGVDNFSWETDKAVLAPIKVGTTPLESLPPSDPWLVMGLLLNDVSEGQRGTISRGDREFYRSASFMVQQGSPFIIPKTDPLSGATITYLLEPFLPMVSYSDREALSPPLVPFDLPGGNHCVKVTTPMRVLIDLGCAPYAQTAHCTPSTRSGHDINTGTEQIKDILELRTMTNAFEYELVDYGQYIVQFDGEVDDT